MLVYHEDRAETRMANEQAAFLVHSEPIWPSVTEGAEEDAHLGGRAVSMQW